LLLVWRWRHWQPENTKSIKKSGGYLSLTSRS